MSSPVAAPHETYPQLPPPVAPAVVQRPPKRPLLALVLGAIFPGVGQLYNGQTAKALALFAAFAASIYLADEVPNLVEARRKLAPTRLRGGWWGDSRLEHDSSFP